MTSKLLQTRFLKQAIFGATFLFTILTNAQTGGGTFELGPTMMRAKLYPTTSVLPNGKVISFGGREYNFISCAYADMYDPITNLFSEAQMNYPHDAFATVKLSDGRYFLLGGGEDLGIAPGYSTTEMYNPVTNKFTPKASMTMKRMQLAGTQLTSGKVLIVGGWYNNNGAKLGEVYDTTTNAFVATDELNDPRAYPIVLPANDGGAVVGGGWPSYGGSVYTSVEYYNANTNKFEELSSEVIPSDEGWLLNTIYTRPIADSKMSNGNYLLLAYRSKPSTQFALIEYNPGTKTFSKLNTTAPLKNQFTDGGFFDLAINKEGNMAYVLGVDSGYIPERLCLVTVDLTNGKVYHPTTTFTLPSEEYFYGALTYIPSIGKILVQGINSTNTSYFTGTNKTYLITPEIKLGTDELKNNIPSKILCYPNPAENEIRIEVNVPEPSEYKILMVDMVGKELFRDFKNELSPGQVIWTLNTEKLSNGFYKLIVQSEDQFITQTIEIKYR